MTNGTIENGRKPKSQCFDPLPHNGDFSAHWSKYLSKNCEKGKNAGNLCLLLYNDFYSMEDEGRIPFTCSRTVYCVLEHCFGMLERNISAQFYFPVLNHVVIRLAGALHLKLLRTARTCSEEHGKLFWNIPLILTTFGVLRVAKGIHLKLMLLAASNFSSSNASIWARLKLSRLKKGK